MNDEVLNLLREWLPPNDSPARPLMQLATVDADGRPDVRSVLLSEWDADGFAFHTDTRSRKVADIAGHAAVAMAVVWPDLPRQLTVQGDCVEHPAAGRRRVYAARSAYLRQLAWVNTDDVAQLDLVARETVWADFAASHDIATLDPPPTWTGFLVRPTRLTFWESHPAAPSRRTEYRLAPDGSWSRRWLAG